MFKWSQYLESEVCNVVNSQEQLLLVYQKRCKVQKICLKNLCSSPSVLCSGVPCQPSREVSLYPMHLQLVKFFITCCSLWSCWYIGDSVICTHCSQGTSPLNRLLAWLEEHWFQGWFLDRNMKCNDKIRHSFGRHAWKIYRTKVTVTKQ